MATVAELEKRIAALETQVSNLLAVLSDGGAPIDKSDPRWWLATAGRFKDDPVFDEIVRLGREWRESQRPGRKKKKVSGRPNVKKPSHANR